ncbi:complement component C9-like [Bufo gargarizans]|uniref:complement component C9-like n=1 Tax=Bufo gargarizans TaxID=30331 RepID=UPI001CF16509|nr:complement component C9-like [Bufo gargarizans]
MAAVLHVLGLTLISCVLYVSGNIRPREVNDPAPIDCQLSSWGTWTECDPCTERKYRSRSIVRFGQFGGARCLSSLGEVQRCKSDKPCEEERIDCGNDYECETGRCVKQRFLCNGDDDCGDYSDEVCDDKDPKPVCRNMEIELSEIGRTAGDGVNILGMETRRNPFDNEYFNGLCNRVRDGNTKTYYRVPWNAASLVYQTKADKSFTTETFKTSIDVLSQVVKEKNEHFEASLSLKLTPTEINKDKLNVTIGVKQFSNATLNKLKELSKTENKEFMRVTGTIQLATFHMRTRNYMLSNSFIEDIKSLPSFYDKAEYFSLMEMYGTHYTISGSVGGKYDLVYILDTNKLNSNQITHADVKSCLGYNIGVNLAAEGVKGDLNVDGSKCEKVLDYQKEKLDKSGIIDNVVSLTEGGTVAFAAKLDAKLLHNKQVDIDDFVEWSSSLVDAPIIIKQKPSPLHTLIPIDLKDAYIKSRNLEKATEEYMNEYSTCKCQPCKNGGTVMVIDGECLCKCPERYKGLACQTPKSELYDNPSDAVDGNWGCWEDSSSCDAGEKTQTRQCDNPAPESGGKPCQGDKIRKIIC